MLSLTDALCIVSFTRNVCGLTSLDNKEELINQLTLQNFLLLGLVKIFNGI